MDGDSNTAVAGEVGRVNVSDSILAEFGNAGWRVYPTGGNCEALRFDYADGLSAWLTDANRPTIPETWDRPCVVGFYRSDEEEALVEFECVGVREAVAVVRSRRPQPTKPART